MRDSIQAKVFRFLDNECILTLPLALGLSGGPDSMCLLHILLEYKKLHPTLQLHLLHVDHGWRGESRSECEELRELAKNFDCSFHFLRLSPEEMKGNLEAECREARLDFFRKMQRQIGAQGVLVGHHLGDQVETVLKRLFEGAHLTRLHGMLPVTRMNELLLFRPLLIATKEEILAYLDAKNIRFFDDATNRDPKFLRARMRQEMLPFLERSFGKEFGQHIERLATESYRIRKELGKRFESIFASRLRGPFGTLYEVEEGLSEIECQELLLELFERQAFHASRAELERGVQALLTNAANKWIGKALYFDRRRVFFWQKNGDADWEMSIQEIHNAPLLNGWRDVWRGKVATRVKARDYRLAKAEDCLHLECASKKLDYYLNEKKVPRQLAGLCPLLIVGDEVIEDFLTSRIVGEGDLYIQLQCKSG